MVENYRKIKRQAKTQLKGQWGKAIAIGLLLVGMLLFFVLFEILLASVLSIVTCVQQYGGIAFYLQTDAASLWAGIALTGTVALLSYLIITPFAMGIRCWFYNLAQRENDNPLATVFIFFSNFRLLGRALLLRFQLAVRMLGMGIVLFALPVFGLAMGLQTAQVFTAPWQMALYGIGMFSTAVLFLAAAFFWWLFGKRYALAVYLICHNPELKNRQAIRRSVAIMRGEKLRLIGFSLTFFPWFLCSLLLVPVLFVFPYYASAHALYARRLITRPQPTTVPDDATVEFTGVHSCSM